MTQRPCRQRNASRPALHQTSRTTTAHIVWSLCMLGRPGSEVNVGFEPSTGVWLNSEPGGVRHGQEARSREDNRLQAAGYGPVRRACWNACKKAVSS